MVAVGYERIKGPRVRGQQRDGTCGASKSMRIDLGDGSIVAVGFTSRGRGKSVVAIEHRKLADRDAAERVKAEWSEKFDALARVLAVART
jgi:hypothetical protein